jgi:hypothetical protein
VLPHHGIITQLSDLVLLRDSISPALSPGRK